MQQDREDTNNSALPSAFSPSQITLAEVYNEHYPNVKRYIAANVNSNAYVEDLVHDVFVQFFRANSCQKTEAYLIGIAKNVLRRFHRDKKYHSKAISIISVTKSLAVSESQKVQVGFRPLLSEQLKEARKQALRQMSPKVREAFKLRFIDGLQIKEAVQKVGCSAHAFHQRLFEARKILKNFRDRSLVENPKAFSEEK